MLFRSSSELQSLQFRAWYFWLSFLEPPPWSSSRRKSALDEVEDPESDGPSGMIVLLEKQVHLQKDVGSMRVGKPQSFWKADKESIAAANVAD